MTELLYWILLVCTSSHIEHNVVADLCMFMHVYSGPRTDPCGTPGNAEGKYLGGTHAVILRQT